MLSLQVRPVFVAGEVVVVGKESVFVDELARLPPGIPVLTVPALVSVVDFPVLFVVVTLVPTVTGPG